MPENEKTHLDPESLDDALAAFTDGVLRGEMIDLRADGSELAELQTGVVQLRRALREPVSRTVANRIYANIVTEWDRLDKTSDNYSKRKGMHRFLMGLGQWRPVQQQRRAYSLALAGLMIILLVSLFVLETSPPITSGSAQFQPLVAIGAVTVLIIAITIWRISQRKE